MPGLLRTCILCLVLVLSTSTEVAAQARLAWDRSTDPATIGYVVAYGTIPSAYTMRIDVGNRTDFDMPVLPDGTYYVAVQGYSKAGANSAFSNEVAIVITTPLANATPEQKRADFDNDGQSDILWQNTSTGQLVAWTLQGTRVKTESALVPSSVSDLNWRIAGTGDFNEDSRPDIVWHNKSTGALAVWHMSALKYVGASGFSMSQPDPSWNVAGVGDFNSDGRPDVLWQHDTGLLKLWTMNRTTVTSDAAYYSNLVDEPSWRAAGVLDVNSDGRADILWRNSNGWLATWLMQGISTIADTLLLDPIAEYDPAWRIAGYIDANQDGKPDIVWQHATQGTVRLWLMDGIKRLQSVTINQTSLSGPNWKVVGPK